MLTKEEYERLCELTCNSYVLPEGIGEAQAEENMLWLICREVAATLNIDFFFQPGEFNSNAEMYRERLIHWTKNPTEFIPVVEIAHRAINRKLGRPEDSPALNK